MDLRTKKSLTLFSAFILLIGFQISLKAGAAHLSCSGDLPFRLKKGKPFTKTQDTIIARKDSSILQLLDHQNKKVGQVHPWWGIYLKKFPKTLEKSQLQLKVSGDNNFVVQLSYHQKIKQLECDVSYE